MRKFLLISLFSLLGTEAFAQSRPATVPGCVAGISCFASQLFLGGYTPDSNALGVTGTANFSGQVTSSAYFAAANFYGSSNSGAYHLGASNDVIMSRAAPATLRFGDVDVAAPVAQTLQVQSVAGTSNTAGQPLTINLSAGTGSAGGGNFVINCAPAGMAGSSQNARSACLTLNGNTGAISTAANITAATGVLVTTGDFVAPVGGNFRWLTLTRLGAPTDGTLQITNNAISQSVNLTVGASNRLTTNGPVTTGGSLTAAGDYTSTGTIPTVSGTGTPTIVAGSTDTAGEVTSGASAISVVITFTVAKTNAPFCTVTPQTQLAAFAYTISTTAITITQALTSGEKIDYHCFQH